MIGNLPIISDIPYLVNNEWHQPHELTGPVYHNTQIKYLLQGHENSAHKSLGIFIDGGLAWGTCTHRGKKGVYYNSGKNGGAQTFDNKVSINPEDAWIALECITTAGSRLKGGAPDRYCISSKERDTAFGPICPYIGIQAILIPLQEVPACVRLT